jgi:hypothetical protein
MRIRLSFLILIAVCLCLPLLAQEANPDAGQVVSEGLGVLEFVLLHWVSILLSVIGVIEVIVRLTPTTKDDAWFKWLRRIVDSVVPNRSRIHQEKRHPTP